MRVLAVVGYTALVLAVHVSASQMEDIPVEIGPSEDNTKCFTHATPLQCVADAGHKDKRITENHHDDTFVITVDDKKVCARRTDKEGGWGMDLQIWCQQELTDTDDVIVTIGPLSTDETNEKCVEQTDVLVCDDDAGHAGKRVNAHSNGDTFLISVKGKKVCAKRTDENKGWAMNLKIKCQRRPTVTPFPFVYVFCGIGLVCLVGAFVAWGVSTRSQARTQSKFSEEGTELPSSFTVVP